MEDLSPPRSFHIAVSADAGRWRWSVRRGRELAGGHAPTKPAARHCAEMTAQMLDVFGRVAVRRG